MLADVRRQGVSHGATGCAVAARQVQAFALTGCRLDIRHNVPNGVVAAELGPPDYVSSSLDVDQAAGAAFGVDHDVADERIVARFGQDGFDESATGWCQVEDLGGSGVGGA